MYILAFGDLSKATEVLNLGECVTQDLLQQVTFFPQSAGGLDISLFSLPLVLFHPQVNVLWYNSDENHRKLASDSTVKGSVCSKLKFMSPQNSCVEALTSREAIFGDRISKEVIKGGALIQQN